MGGNELIGQLPHTNLNWDLPHHDLENAVLVMNCLRQITCSFITFWAKATGNLDPYVFSNGLQHTKEYPSPVLQDKASHVE